MRQIDRIDRVVERQPHVPSHGVGVHATDLDDHCMIVTDGCAHCHPEEDEYRLKVIRLSEIVYRDLLRDGEPMGNA